MFAKKIKNQQYQMNIYPVNIYSFKVNNRDTRKGLKYVQS